MTHDRTDHRSGCFPGDPAHSTRSKSTEPTMWTVLALVLGAVFVVAWATSCTTAPADDDDTPAPVDPCDEADDPWLDSDSDGWPDCADCMPHHVRIPRLEECPEEEAL